MLIRTNPFPPTTPHSKWIEHALWLHRATHARDRLSNEKDRRRGPSKGVFMGPLLEFLVGGDSHFEWQKAHAARTRIEPISQRGFRSNPGRRVTLHCTLKTHSVPGSEQNTQYISIDHNMDPSHMRDKCCQTIVHPCSAAVYEFGGALEFHCLSSLRKKQWFHSFVFFNFG